MDDFATGFLSGQDSGNNSNGFWGDGLWAIIILAMLGFGRNGLGGIGGGSPVVDGNWATQADVRAAVDQQTLISKLDQQTYGLADATYSLNNTAVNGFHGVDTAICNLGYNVQSGFNDIAHRLSDCCCTTQRAIDAVNYNMAKGFGDLGNVLCNQTRDIIENQNANYRGLMDYMVQTRMDALQSENADLRLKASQAAQNQYLVDQLRPTPVPAYITCSPFASASGYSTGCGCA